MVEDGFLIGLARSKSGDYMNRGDLVVYRLAIAGGCLSTGEDGRRRSLADQFTFTAQQVVQVLVQVDNDTRRNKQGYKYRTEGIDRTMARTPPKNMQEVSESRMESHAGPTRPPAQSSGSQESEVM